MMGDLASAYWAQFKTGDPNGDAARRGRTMIPQSPRIHFTNSGVIIHRPAKQTRSVEECLEPRAITGQLFALRAAICNTCPCTTIFSVTRERWAQIGITTQFLIVVRTLGEIFRLRHSLGTSFSVAIAMPYLGGVLIAAISCWLSVTLFFFRRYTLAACVAAATVLVLLVYKISVIAR